MKFYFVFGLLNIFVLNCFGLDQIITELSKLHTANEDQIKNFLYERIINFRNTSFDPCENFHKYACGNFGLFNQLSGYSANNLFDLVIHHLRSTLKQTLENLSKNMKKNKDLQSKHPYKKVWRYFKSCIKLEKVQKSGFQSLKDLIKSIETGSAFDEAWNKTNISIFSLLGKLKHYGYENFISFSITPDYTNLRKHVLIFAEPQDSFMIGKFGADAGGPRMEIATKVGNIIRLLTDGNSKISSIKNAMIKFEKTYRKITTQEDKKGLSWVGYEKMTIEELQMEIPDVNWGDYLQALYGKSFNASQKIILQNRKYFENLGRFLQTQTLEDIVNHIMINFAESILLYAGYDSESIEEYWWSTCIESIQKYMPEPLDALFVDTYLKKERFSEASKIAEHVRETFRGLISDADWVDDYNKMILLKKLDDLNVTRMGIPEYFYDHDLLLKMYSSAKVDTKNFFKNTVELMKLKTRKALLLSGTEIGPDDFDSSPSVVYAENNVLKNRVSVGLVFLYTVYFDNNYPSFYKYAVLGYTLAHELAHGFDNIGGAVKNANGTLIPELYQGKTHEYYKNKTKCFLKEYRTAGLKAKKFLNEVLGDSVGLKVAYYAYMNWLKENPEIPELVPGLNMTNKQLFFTTYVQHRCAAPFEGSTNDNKTLSHPYGNIEAYDVDSSDPHPPEIIRNLGSLRLSKEFADSFGCHVNSKMNPKKKCELF